MLPSKFNERAVTKNRFISIFVHTSLTLLVVCAQYFATALHDRAIRLFFLYYKENAIILRILHLGHYGYF